MESLRTGLSDGDMRGTLTDTKAFMKACSGDIVLVVTPATATPAATTEAWSQVVTATLKTADGEVHKWYSGPVTIAVSKSSSGGTAAISPTAGAKYMTDGVFSFTLSGTGTWAQNDTATATVTAVAQQGLLGLAISATTCVVTFGA
jgi:hypothetical protein